MLWIWELKNWPNLEYDHAEVLIHEKEFYTNAGIISGLLNHLEKQNIILTNLAILTQEAIATSSIEGEFLDAASVQSSIKKHLGLMADKIKIPTNAAAIAEMMTDIYLNFNTPLQHQTFYNWHTMLMNGRREIETIGAYRTHDDAMQIVSNNLTSPTVYFEAPPSKCVYKEMQQLIKWINENFNKISIIALASIAHLHFEIIHPFEDGNGRIGRALIEKIISKKLQMPALLSIAKIIEQNKKEYYENLKASNHSLNINRWIQFFTKIILQAQRYTIDIINFTITKKKFFEKYNSKINNRQQKVLLRIFNEGIEGFKGGLSAANYKSIAITSAATTTRDLQELLILEAINKTGVLKSTRYHLNLQNL